MGNFKGDTAMLAQLSATWPERSLDDFYGDSAARVDEFIGVWSKDLPPDLRSINDKICLAFLRKGRTRFSVWFKMVYTEVDAIVSDSGGDDGWRATVEDLTGFKFETPKAPGLNELAPSVGQRRKAEDTKADDLCVSARLSMAGSLLDEHLPDACYSVVQTEAPHEMTEPELSAFTDEVLMHIASKFGDWKLGMQLARQYGKEGEARLPPLPQYGGRSRKGKLGKIIWQKCKNRLYVRRPAQFTALTSPFELRCNLSHCAALGHVQEAARRQRHRPHRGGEHSLRVEA